MNPRRSIRDSFAESTEVLLLAAAAGVYVSVFYIAGNVTMLPPKGMLIVVVALVLPIVLATAIVTGIARMAGLKRYANVAALIVILVCVFAALRTPVFSIPAISELLSRLHGPVSVLLHVFLVLAPAVLVGLLFRKNINKLTIIFGVMSVAAVGMNVVEGLRDKESTPGAGGWWNDIAAPAVHLERRPNIYLIVPDSYGSMAYMQELGIDVSDLRAELENNDFRFYDDAFSNYHPTLPSMLSMLNMTHHFYAPLVKESEVVALGRKSIGGDNALLRLLSGNGYASEYLHASNYLLLQGCSADVCYPEPAARDSAARLLDKIVPYAEMISTRGTKQTVRAVPLAKVRNRLGQRLAAIRESADPHFTYVHIAEPGHPPTVMRGRCDESYEHEAYSRRIGTANTFLKGAINEIIGNDPAAVIVLAGDHGPWIKNRCETVADLQSVTGYRDRLGALLAVRWPRGYAGEYDGNIKTPINIFRYILADLAENNEQLLATVQAESAFIQGTNGIAEVLAEGEIVGPPHASHGPEPR